MWSCLNLSAAPNTRKTMSQPVIRRKSKINHLRTVGYYLRHGYRIAAPQPVEATYVVLGMHRSGTSLAAGLLHRMGISFGHWQLDGNPNNPKGHFENILIYWMNKKLLRAAGGSWADPPTPEAIERVGRRYRHRIQALVRMEQQRQWGWKDPRAVLTLPLFLPYLQHVRLVDCRRDPQAIARSLAKRDSLPLAQGTELARLYHDRLDDLLAEVGRAGPMLRLEFDDWFDGERNGRKLAEFADRPLTPQLQQMMREFIISR
jgi:hypothetical protein